MIETNNQANGIITSNLNLLMETQPKKLQAYTQQNCDYNNNIQSHYTSRSQKQILKKGQHKNQQILNINFDKNFVRANGLSKSNINQSQQHNYEICETKSQYLPFGNQNYNNCVRKTVRIGNNIHHYHYHNHNHNISMNQNAQQEPIHYLPAMNNDFMHRTTTNFNLNSKDKFDFNLASNLPIINHKLNPTSPVLPNKDNQKQVKFNNQRVLEMQKQKYVPVSFENLVVQTPKSQINVLFNRQNSRQNFNKQQENRFPCQKFTSQNQRVNKVVIDQQEQAPLAKNHNNLFRQNSSSYQRSQDGQSLNQTGNKISKGTMIDDETIKKGFNRNFYLTLSRMTANSRLNSSYEETRQKINFLPSQSSKNEKILIQDDQVNYQNQQQNNEENIAKKFNKPSQKNQNIRTSNVRIVNSIVNVTLSPKHDESLSKSRRKRRIFDDNNSNNKNSLFNSRQIKQNAPQSNISFGTPYTNKFSTINQRQILGFSQKMKQNIKTQVNNYDPTSSFVASYQFNSLEMVSPRNIQSKPKVQTQTISKDMVPQFILKQWKKREQRRNQE